MEDAAAEAALNAVEALLTYDAPTGRGIAQVPAAAREVAGIRRWRASSEGVPVNDETLGAGMRSVRDELAVLAQTSDSHGQTMDPVRANVAALQWELNVVRYGVAAVTASVAATVAPSVPPRTGEAATGCCRPSVQPAS